MRLLHENNTSSTVSEEVIEVTTGKYVGKYVQIECYDSNGHLCSLDEFFKNSKGLVDAMDDVFEHDYLITLHSPYVSGVIAQYATNFDWIEIEEFTNMCQKRDMGYKEPYYLFVPNDGLLPDEWCYLIISKKVI